MKKILCALAAVLLLTLNVFAAVKEYGSAEMSEAISIMDECKGQPGKAELEQLYGLGLTDEDIDGLTVVSSLKKDKADITPYIVVAAALVVLAVSVICAVRLCKGNK